MILYIKQGDVDSFRKGLNFYGSRDKDEVILEFCSRDERAHMAFSKDSEGDFFYMYLFCNLEFRGTNPIYNV